MNSYNKQTKWAYRPLSARRRDSGSGRETSVTSSIDPGSRRSSSGQSIELQRSSSVASNQDILTSQIKDFLQRTDRSSRERWRSKSRSIDTSKHDVAEAVALRSHTLSPNAHRSEASLSSRENSIWEQEEQMSQVVEVEEVCSSISSEKLDHPSYRLRKECNSENYLSNNYLDHDKSMYERKSYTVKSRFLGHGTGNSVAPKDELDSVPKQKYDSLMNQLHITKIKLTQEHEMEIDKLLSLKKQLEKKLYDSCEALDEQKLLVCQWKKKFNKLSSDFSEVKLQLEDLLSQKCLIEKKRKKEESDFQYLVEELNQEKKLNDKLIKEKEIIHQDKLKLDETISDLKIELQTKSIQIKALNEEVSNCKGSISEQEVENFTKTINRLKNKCLELEEELENSARQVEKFEETIYKLEQNVERLRKEHKQEISQREEEVDEVRYSMEKKIKALHCQLEQEHHEKTLIMKEKYKLERQIEELRDNVCQSQSTATSLLDKMKNKLIKTKALLKDEKIKEQSKSKETNKLLLRKLKNQLDGVELEKLTAIKTKQKYEMEYEDLATSMTELERAKNDTEKKLEGSLREIKSQQKLLDDKEEQITEVMSRFTSNTQQLAENQAVIQDLTEKMSTMEQENASLIEKIASLKVKLDNKESLASSTSKLQAETFKAKIKELECKLELDKTMISRKEQHLSQLTVQLEKAISENDKAQTILNDTARELKSYNRHIKDLQEETKKLTLRETELLMRNKDLALRVEATETEKNMLISELKLANERIFTLKEAMDDSTSCFSDSTESAEDTTLSGTVDNHRYRSPSPESLYSGISDREYRRY